MQPLPNPAIIRANVAICITNATLWWYIVLTHQHTGTSASTTAAIANIINLAGTAILAKRIKDNHDHIRKYLPTRPTRPRQ